MTRFFMLLCAGLFLLSPNANSQFDEVGLFMGISHYSGDLTERTLEPLGFHRAGGFYLRKKLTSRLGMKYHFYKGRISGDDALSSSESGLWRRNLSFESDIFELGAVAEYSFFKFGHGDFETTPYLYGGVAAFYFSPQAEVDGKIYDLNRYRTEGVEYSLYQFAVPFGVGLKMRINGCGNLGLEAGFRKTFTDYLDDVSGYYPTDLRPNYGDGQGLSTRTMLSYRSVEIDAEAPAIPRAGGQRGNPDRNDWYMFFGLTLGVDLK